MAFRAIAKPCNHTLDAPPIDVFSLCISSGTVFGFISMFSQPSLVLIALCSFLRAYYMHRHSHLNAYRSMVAFCWSVVAGFATIAVTYAKFWHAGFGDVASVVLIFVSVLGMAVLGVLLGWRRTAAAQHYGVPLLLLIPMACTWATINTAIKPFRQNDPVTNVNTLIVHVLYVIFLATSGLTGLSTAVFMMRVRAQQLQDADELIAEDKANYDRTWAHILASHPNIRQVIASLADVVAAWRSEYDAFKSGNTPANRPADLKLVDTTLKTMLRVSRMATASSKHTGRPRQQVADVCVLFAQAGALNDHFQGLVLRWAEGLSGAIVHSSPVKRRARAIEKLPVNIRVPRICARSTGGCGVACCPLLRLTSGAPLMTSSHSEGTGLTTAIQAGLLIWCGRRSRLVRLTRCCGASNG